MEKQVMSAVEVMKVARQLSIKGALVKQFRSGQELRAYTLPSGNTYKIRALPSEHVA